MEESVEMKRFPLGLGGKIVCGDDKKALLILGVRLLSGLDGHRDLMKYEICSELFD